MDIGHRCAGRSDGTAGWRPMSKMLDYGSWRRCMQRFWLTAGHVVLTVFAILMLVFGLLQPRGAGAAEPAAGTARATPRIALHYGADAPLDTLRAFDVVVVDPDHGFDPIEYRVRNRERSELYAYVSVGELDPRRAFAPGMPPSMLLGTNAEWGTRYIDPAHPDWPAFLMEHVVTPLWERGYRGFFLDTMDAYRATPGDERTLQARADGLVRALTLLKARHPDAHLIANRGFELLPRIHRLLDVVAAESMFGRWDASAGRYVDVPPADRAWLIGQFDAARALGLGTLAIDYVDPADRTRQAQVAAKIVETGAMPWVTDGAIASVGIGSIRVVPRSVLVVHNGTQAGDENFSSAHQLLAMPLQYLGYRVELLDVERYPLPGGVLGGRYAAIVGVFEAELDAKAAQWTDLLARARAQSVPIALFNGFGASPADGLGRVLGLQAPEHPPLAPIRVVAERRPLTSFEIPALAMGEAVGVPPPTGADPIVRLRDARGEELVGAAFMPWGGFALRPFTWNSEGMLWVIDPIAFLRQALVRDDPPPVPDVTTEAGRRLLMVHIDGDGFASRAEIPGSPFAAEVMLRDFIARYPVPHTVSVIEGEIAPHGLHPTLSPALERIARDIFRLEHVEIATHTYSHPFYWNALAQAAEEGVANDASPSGGGEGRGYGHAHGRTLHLPLPDYRFSLDREIAGSARYIDERLAPPGKRTKVLLWTGDCVPPAEAIAAADRAGLLNMNGGDTVITRANPGLTRVAPMSLRKSGLLQVHAPNQNENVYTDNWRGPFYGFERVIETFEMTERPLRLKPIDIYYHTYAASKASSIRALDAVYRYALSQPVAPVYGSEYIRKVQGFESIVFSRPIEAASPPPGTAASVTDGARPPLPAADAWLIRADDDLRTVRLPDADVARIDWARSSGVAGFARGADGAYLHLSAADARIVFTPGPQPLRLPIVESANGRIDDFVRDAASATFRFTSHVPGEFRLVHAASCRVRADGRPLASASSSRADMPGAPDGHRLYRYNTSKPHGAAGNLVSIDC